MSGRRFWIRKDRENYFLSGVIIACTIGAFVSSYWHFTDRISVRQKIQIKGTQAKEKAPEKLREVQYTPSKLKVGNRQYYKMEEPVGDSVPRPGEDDGN